MIPAIGLSAGLAGLAASGAGISTIAATAAGVCAAALSMTSRLGKNMQRLSHPSRSPFDEEAAKCEPKRQGKHYDVLISASSWSSQE